MTTPTPGLPILFERMAIKVRAERLRLNQMCPEGDVELNEAVFGFGPAIVSSTRSGLVFRRWGTVLNLRQRYDWDDQYLESLVFANGLVLSFACRSEIDDYDTVVCFRNGSEIAALTRIKPSVRGFGVQQRGLSRLIGRSCFRHWSLMWKGQRAGVLRVSRAQGERTCGTLRLCERRYEIPLSRGANIALQRRRQRSGELDRETCGDYLFPLPPSKGDDALICGIVHLMCRRDSIGFVAE